MARRFHSGPAGGEVAKAVRSVADVLAGLVQLLVEVPPLSAGQVAVVVVGLRKGAFLHADRAKIAAQVARLVPAHVALANLMPDPDMLLGDAVIDLHAARMAGFPASPGFGSGGDGKSAED